jgi:hypothetical protein
MTDGDTPGGAGALRRLRQRWLAPSRPLAVDDEPRWEPAADPDADASGLGDPAVAPAPRATTP